MRLDQIVEIFNVETSHRAAPAPQAGPGGIRGMQEKLKAVAGTYLKRGNAAQAQDWSEF